MHMVSTPKLANERPPEVRVQIVIGAALIMQTALALIWTGRATERIAQLERRADANAAMIERTARLEEQARHMAATLSRIEVKIDRQSKEARND